MAVMDLPSAVKPPPAAQVQKLGRDRALAVLAGRQHTIVAHRQLVTLGFSRHTITHMVDRSRLRVVHRGVYAVGPARLTREARWMAAVLAAGPAAVLSHRSAAALWRLISDDGRVVEVTVDRDLRPRTGVHARFTKLRDDELTTVDGVSVTTVARTILDLAAVLPRQRLERAMDEAEVRQLTDATTLPALLDRHPRRRGAGVLRQILAEHLAATITRSEFEERFLAFLIDNALPRPLVNHQIPDAGECDFAWPEARLIVELDGYATHGTRRGFEADRARDRALQVAGWRVIRITWRQLRDEPRRIVADLYALLCTRPEARSSPPAD